MKSEQRKTRITGTFYGTLDLQSIHAKAAQLLMLNDVFLTKQATSTESFSLRYECMAASDDADTFEQTKKKLCQLSEADGVPLVLSLLSSTESCHWFSICAPANRADLSTLQQVFLQLLSVANMEMDSANIVNFSEVAAWLQNIAEDPDKPDLTTLVDSVKLEHYARQRLNVRRYRRSGSATAVYQRSLQQLTTVIAGKAQQCKVSLAVVVGAAIRTVLQEYNSKAELAYVCSVRSDESLQAVFGPLTSVLPLQSKPGQTFLDTIKYEQQALDEISAVAECFYQSGVSSYCHVYECFENHLFEQIRVESVVHDVADSALSFMLLAQGNDLQLSVTYNTDDFDENILALMCTKIESLLEHEKVSHQPWMAIASAVTYPFNSLAVWSEFNLKQRPESLITEAFGGQCTTAELHQRAGQLANHLRELGVRSGSHVVIYLERSIDFFVSILAVTFTGATYVPLDDALPLRRVQQIAAQLEPACILTKGSLLQLSEKFHVIDLDTLSLQHYASHIEMPQVSLSDVAYIIFTSGSTGEPKGIEISHGALLNHMTWFINNFNWDSQDVLLQKTNAGFDASVWEFWLVLLTGIDCVIAAGSSSYDLDQFIKVLQEYRITTLQLVPSYLALLLDHAAFGPALALNKLFCGGEALKTSIASQASERISAQLVNLYGPSECCIDATSFQYKAGLGSDFVPIGYPISNLKSVVLQDSGQFAEVGQTGELLIAGPSVFNGYFQDEDKTRAAIYLDDTGERYYRTGDLVQILPDGQLYFIGRMDNQVKLNGFRVDLNAISSTAESLAGVIRAECFFQEESRQLVLFCKTTDPAAESLIKQHLTAELPAYMVPERYQLIDEFPLTSNGKVDAKKLLRQCAVVRADYQAPANGLEAAIAAVWQEVFKKTKPVSVTDNFFSLGGDSILGIKVVYQLNKAGIDVALLTLIKHPTIRAMAQMIQQMPATAAPQHQQLAELNVPPELAAQYQDVYPATGMQSFILRQYDQDHKRLGVFQPQGLIWLRKSDISYAELQHLLASEMQHVNFRTRFVETRQGLFQVLLSHSSAECHHLQAANESQFQQLIRQTLQADNQRPFDWRNPQLSLVRVYYIEGPGDDIVVIMSNLHTIQDGWGNVEFKNHLRARYLQTSNATAEEISELPNVCKEFALQELQLQQNPEIAGYWKQQAGQFSQSCWQYHDFGCEAIHSMQQQLPSALLDNARRWAKLHGVQLKTVLLSALSKAVSTVLGEQRAAFGLVANGRNSALSDPLHAMGLFWNLVPLKLPGNEEVTRLARSAHQLLIELEPYSRYPFNEQIKLHQGLMPVWCTFNYVDFHHREYGQVAEPEDKQETGQVSPEQTLLGQDYFGFPLESSFSMQGAQCSWFIQFNPVAVSAAELKAVVAEFKQQLGYFVP